MTDTTPTGIAIVDCTTCGHRHNHRVTHGHAPSRGGAQ